MGRKLQSTELCLKFILCQQMCPYPLMIIYSRLAEYPQSCYVSLCYRFNGNKGLNKKDWGRPRLSEREGTMGAYDILGRIFFLSPTKTVGDKSHLMHLRLSASL